MQHTIMLDGYIDGVGLIICRVGCNDGSCKFCSQNRYRGECLGCLNGSYGPADHTADHITQLIKPNPDKPRLLAMALLITQMIVVMGVLHWSIWQSHRLNTSGLLCSNDKLSLVA